MRAVGPDAPTLCGGWTVRDLAAHLLLRERRLDVSAGIMVPFMAARMNRVQKRIAEQDWDVMLHKLAAGPPIWSPFRPIDFAVNSLEYYAHHEDVRRAQDDWQPRQFDQAGRRSLRRSLSIAVFTYRKAPVRVELAIPGGDTVVANRRAPATVRLTGEPSELVLHAIGRDRVVIEFEGKPEDIVALNATSRAI